ncbi:MAG: hypothetical protein IPO06_02515 [Leptospiraceae bacterium]|nr:hypothetical protein [Leptospiraceae bacterium]
MNVPWGVAVDAGGVYIVDSKNHRVLYYPGTSTTATRVYGQGGSILRIPQQWRSFDEFIK